MKIKTPATFAADYPSLGKVDVPPGTDLEVTDEAIAGSLLLQGHEPVDKEAKELLKRLTTPEPIAAPDPEES